MVGAAGFEPTTPCPPDKCATGLRYAPTCLNGSFPLLFRMERRKGKKRVRGKNGGRGAAHASAGRDLSRSPCRSAGSPGRLPDDPCDTVTTKRDRLTDCNRVPSLRYNLKEARMRCLVAMCALAWILAGCATSSGNGPTLKCDTYIQENADAATTCY